MTVCGTHLSKIYGGAPLPPPQALQKTLFGTENAPECISRDVNFKNFMGRPPLQERVPPSHTLSLACHNCPPGTFKSPPATFF